MLRRAVSAYNRTVDRLEKSGRFDLVPNKTSMQVEMGRINSRDQLYQRVKELRRILKSVKPDAQNPVEYMGAVVPLYMKREIEGAKRIINAERRKSRYANFPGWDEMTPRERVQAETSGNIGDLQGEYSTPDDLDDLTSQRYAESDANYMRKYIDVWHDYCVVRKYEQQVVDDIEWLIDNRPNAIREILDRGYIQAQIDYIYSESDDYTDTLTKHNNIVDFWRDMREYYA